MKLHFRKSSESQRSRRRQRNTQKQSMRHIGDKKRVRQEDVDSAYLFGNAQSANCAFCFSFWFCSTGVGDNKRLTFHSNLANHLRLARCPKIGHDSPEVQAAKNSDRVILAPIAPSALSCWRTIAATLRASSWRGEIISDVLPDRSALRCCSTALSRSASTSVTSLMTPWRLQFLPAGL